MLNKKNILAFVSFIALGCGGGGSGDSDSHTAVTVCPRVINGEACTPSGSPILKLLISSVGGVQSLCSGTAISSNTVLTAAHCFLTTNVLSVVVDTGSKFVNVSTINVHPSVQVSNNAIFNDVAIVVTNKSLDTPTLPIVLSQTVESGDLIGINGFGIDETGFPGIFKGGTMKVSKVTVNHIGAIFDGTLSNTCNGDSGGPATLTLPSGVGVIGLTSSGLKPDCSSGDETLFTNLQSQSVLDFITSIVPEVGTI